MFDKYQNKYRIPSARLQNWDYGSNAIYFVTICTQNRVCCFGDVENGAMVLAEIGDVARQCWYNIPNHFPFVALGEFVVMPNHVHGIIVIDKPVNVETQNFASPHPNIAPLPTNFASLQPGNKFGPQSQNLASIVRGFKIGVTKFARANNIGFDWQSRYHDHVVRNDESFQRISNYIATNPQRWHDDKFYDCGSRTP